MAPEWKFEANQIDRKIEEEKKDKTMSKLATATRTPAGLHPARNSISVSDAVSDYITGRPPLISSSPNDAQKWESSAALTPQRR